MIYIQAKRWRAVVGRPEIQKFVGALEGKKAKKEYSFQPRNFQREQLIILKILAVKLF